MSVQTYFSPFSSQHAKLHEAEYNEVHGKRVTCSPNNQQGAAGHIHHSDKLRRSSQCGLGGPCAYYLRLIYNSTANDGAGGYKVVEFVPHSCDKKNTITLKQPSSAYTFKHLAHIIASKLYNNAKFFSKNVEAEVFPAYIQLKPPPSLCKAVLKQARAISSGKAHDMIKKLPAYCAALRARGHGVKVSARVPALLHTTVCMTILSCDGH